MSSASGDIPQKIGVYQVEERIAEGGFGVVYRGFDPRLKREVAIKVLHPQHSSEPSRVARFLREAQSAARLNCPGIVQIYDIVEENQRLALVMEYVHGKNLDRFLKDNPNLSLVERIDIGIQIAEALYLAHQADIVHRDVKPANILVDAQGNVKLTDFNLARLRDTSLTPLTGEHNVLGTPAYMSPEQCLGKEATPQSDIYSLGVVLYFLFTGSLPFEAENYLALMRQHTDTPPTPVRLINPDLPVALEKLISQCLLKNPEGRPSSGKEIADLLREVKADLLKRRSGEMTPVEQKTMVLTEGSMGTPEFTPQPKEATPSYPITPHNSNKLQHLEAGATPYPNIMTGQGTPVETGQITPSTGTQTPTLTPTPPSTDGTSTMPSPTPVTPTPDMMGVSYTPVSTPNSLDVSQPSQVSSGFKSNILFAVLLVISIISLCLSGFLLYTFYYNEKTVEQVQNSKVEMKEQIKKKEYDYSGFLSKFVKDYDNAYKVEVYAEKQGEGYKAYFLDFVSQSWHPEKTVPPVWRHWLTLIIPNQRVKDIGMLVLTEGLSTNETPMSEIPPYFISLAVSSKSVVAILEGFPRDKVGIYETPTKVVNLELTEFASWSLKQYFETYDPGWVIFCPMVKSVVRAMDAVQEFLLKNLRSEIPLKEFVLCGDAPFFVPWLVPPMDSRVIGLVSVNVSVFHLEQQIKRMFMDEINLPPLFAEMDDAGILPLLETEDGENLLKVIDPYSYSTLLHIPKLVISLGNQQGCNLVSLSEQAISEIPEPVNWLMCLHLQLSREFAFLPQQLLLNFSSSTNTPIYDFKDTIRVFYHRILGQKNMPTFHWEFSPTGECTVKASEEIIECRAWYCSKDKRGDIFNLMNKDWKCKILSEVIEKTYRTTISIPSQQYTAVFLEVIFPSLMGVPYTLTSNIHIITPRNIGENIVNIE
ncbi:MAG TPA: PhoPQ-activated protein PqaA family protein [Candidatus Hydrogenedens sp.]|nr:PhoPQ-activated protein PqaA family protein [Candidatus Hydrogenedens sp.]